MTQSKLRTLLNQLDRQNTDYTDDDAQAKSSLQAQQQGERDSATIALELIQSLTREQFTCLQYLLKRGRTHG